MFYLREFELQSIINKTIEENEDTKIFLVSGSKKIGKTTFIKKYTAAINGIYITVTHLPVNLQLLEIRGFLVGNYPVFSDMPVLESWSDFFSYLYNLSKTNKISLIIDEFQNIYKQEPVSLEVLNILHKKNKGLSKLNLVLVTHDNETIEKSFRIQNSPLFQTQYYELKLKPFDFSEFFTIYKENNSRHSIEEILNIYLIFGGFPKYIHLLGVMNLWNDDLETLLEKLLFSDFAPLSYEFKEFIFNHFSKESKTYLHILEAIASDKNTITEISKYVNIPVTTISKYVLELDKRRRVIKRKVPLTTDPDINSKFGRYYITSYFENFWFRFIQPNITAYEMKQYDKVFADVLAKIPEYLKERQRLIVKEFVKRIYLFRNYDKMFKGLEFEVGAIWNRREQIDIVAVDKFNMIMICAFYLENEQCNKEDILDAIKKLNHFKELVIGYRVTFIIFYNQKISQEALSLCKKNSIVPVESNAFIAEMALKSGYKTHPLTRYIDEEIEITKETMR